MELPCWDADLNLDALIALVIKLDQHLCGKQQRSSFCQRRKLMVDLVFPLSTLPLQSQCSWGPLVCLQRRENGDFPGTCAYTLGKLDTSYPAIHYDVRKTKYHSNL